MKLSAPRCDDHGRGVRWPPGATGHSTLRPGRRGESGVRRRFPLRRFRGTMGINGITTIHANLAPIPAHRPLGAQMARPAGPLEPKVACHVGDFEAAKKGRNPSIRGCPKRWATRILGFYVLTNMAFFYISEEKS